MPTHNCYGDFPLRSITSSMNDLSDNTNTVVKCALLTSNYTPDMAAHSVWSDISADEVSDTSTGYTAGGVELTNKSVNQTSGQTTFSADDAVWTDSTISADYAVAYEEGTGTLISLVTFDSTQDSDNGEFRVEWDSAGVFDMNT